MQIIRNFITGLLSVLKIIGGPMLYRYPYRTSAEAFHADWNNIGKDIESVIGQLDAEKTHGKRRKK